MSELPPLASVSFPFFVLSPPSSSFSFLLLWLLCVLWLRHCCADTSNFWLERAGHGVAQVAGEQHQRPHSAPCE